MRFLRRYCDPATVDLMTRVMEEAWREAGDLHALNVTPEDAHAAMVLRIVVAVNEGERDPTLLKKLALNALR